MSAAVAAGNRAAQAPAAPAPTGELRLAFAVRGARTVAVGQYHTGALRVLRGHYPHGSGQPAYTVVNPGGGYVGGDRYATEATLGPGAAALLTTQSATRIYRTPQGPAVASLRFTLDAGARLEVLPDPVIAYRDAHYQQDTDVEMAADASLALAETVTHGWAPDGRPFRFEEVSLRARVRVGGRLAVVDNVLIRPDAGGTAPLMLGGRSHVGSLLVVDPHADDGAIAALRTHLAERFPSPQGALVGITRLAVPGFALRVLAGSTDEAEALLHAALDFTRAEWHGLPPIALRKY